MTQITVKIDHAVAEAELTGVLTSRMVGVLVRFEFGPIWDGLIKAAVFQGSGASITVMLFRTNEVELPYEVLMSAGSTLKIGVEGRDPGGALVIPSTMVEVGRILEGADPHGTEPGEATEPVWGQIMAKLDALEALTEHMLNVDSALSTTSTNPVQNQAVALRFASLENAFSESIEEIAELIPSLDASLSKTGSAADAGAVGTAIRQVEQAMDLIAGSIPTETTIGIWIDNKLEVIENGYY